MQAGDVIQLVVMIGAGVIWLLYVAEAFRDSVAQGLLTLLLPFYVVYYAYTRARRARPMRIALVVLGLLFLRLA